jgi:parvulin-like peptidyl-prolyl isomerase
VRSRLWLGIFCVAAFVGGILTALQICSSFFWRAQFGTLFGRGHLLALVDGCGIYQADLVRMTQILRDSGRDDATVHSPEMQRSILQDLMAGCALQHRSSRQILNSNAVAREYDLLQSQILPQRAWVLALKRNKLSAANVRRTVALNLRTQSWIENHINEQVRPRPEESLRFYEEHLPAYRQPVRFRASHLFLAAPLDTPPETVETKRVAINVLSDRLKQGEKFADLIAAFSEDEATKKRAGDLGFFSEERMPADFFDQVKNMRAGDLSGVIRTRLGFHIVQLTDSRPSLQMTFEQARGEIDQILQNQKRAIAVEWLAKALSESARLGSPPSG